VTDRGAAGTTGTMSEQIAGADGSDDLADHLRADPAEVPRVHSEDPAEGADPDDAGQAGADVPRVHPQDPAEGATDTTNPQ
jgi:hypothetical protein